MFLKSQFIKILLNIKTETFNKKRNALNIYKNYTSAYWNLVLWDNILKDNSIFSINIDKFMFKNFCKHYCSIEESEVIFSKISTEERYINYQKFNTFLNGLDEFEYINIINTLIKYGDTNNYNIFKNLFLKDNNAFFIKRSKSCPEFINYFKY